MQFLYSNVGKIRKASKSSIVIQYSRLKPTLRPYQESAVQWMLCREQKADDSEILHPRFQKIVLDSGKEIYFDKYTGYIDAAAPMVKPNATGGILADEMGLGKTVEVLACILSHTMDHLTDHKKNIVLNLQKSPVVEMQPKKRKVEYLLKLDDPAVEDFKKVKLSSKKGANYTALRKWYENTLQSISAKKSVIYDNEGNLIQCLCGESASEGLVSCMYCSKLQHAICLDYDKSFGEYICPQCWMNQVKLCF